MNDKLVFGLHGAILRSVTVDWVGATATLELTAFVPTHALVRFQLTELLEIALPRRCPWGYEADVSRVNDARLVVASAGAEYALELTMEGGDIVLARSHSIERHDEAVS